MYYEGVVLQVHFVFKLQFAYFALRTTCDCRQVFSFEVLAQIARRTEGINSFLK